MLNKIERIWTCEAYSPVVNEASFFKKLLYESLIHAVVREVEKPYKHMPGANRAGFHKEVISNLKPEGCVRIC